MEKHQGGDPSLQHEPSTLSVLKNYFFFFAAGFLAAAFFAGFFFAATVTHLPSGVVGSCDELLSSPLIPMDCCFIAETHSAARFTSLCIGRIPTCYRANRAAAECIDDTLLSDAPRQFKKRFWNRLAQFQFLRAIVSLSRAKLVEHLRVRLHQSNQKFCFEHAQ